MTRRVKLPEMCVDSPASGARFVGWRFVVQDTFAVKDLLAKRLKKLLHEMLTLATTKI